MAKIDKAIEELRIPAATAPMTPWRRYRATIFQAYLSGAVVVFLAMAILAKTAAYFTFDVTITHAVQSWHGVGFAELMGALTWLGFAPQTYVISVGVIVFLFLRGLKWETAVTSASLVGSESLDLGVKTLVDRPRPSVDLVHVVNQLKDYSFPSGHVMYFTTFFGFLLFLTFALIKPSWWRTLLLVLLGGMVALIGLSRIYEGQHWASDVIGAYLLGSIWLSLTIVIYRWGKSRYFVKPKEPRS
jgi:membrane-associated phospholipid phosphatase